MEKWHLNNNIYKDSQKSRQKHTRKKKKVYKHITTEKKCKQKQYI